MFKLLIILNFLCINLSAFSDDNFAIVEVGEAELVKNKVLVQTFFEKKSVFTKSDKKKS